MLEERLQAVGFRHCVWFLCFSSIPSMYSNQKKKNNNKNLEAEVKEDSEAVSVPLISFPFVLQGGGDLWHLRRTWNLHTLTVSYKCTHAKGGRNRRRRGNHSITSQLLVAEQTLDISRKCKGKKRFYSKRCHTPSFLIQTKLLWLRWDLTPRQLQRAYHWVNILPKMHT